MDVIILIFFVLLIATLLLGIWQIKNPKLKTADDLSDDLCLYCPLDDVGTTFARKTKSVFPRLIKRRKAR